MKSAPNQLKDRVFCNREWLAILRDSVNTYNNDVNDWSVIYEWFRDHCRGHKVLDVGCGLGHIGKLLSEAGHDVTCLDFSSVAISQAKQRAPKCKFICEDITTERGTHILKSGYDSICFSEVLEHIKDDLKVIIVIPEGTEILLSVPPQPSDGHVRWFDSLDDACERYSKYIDIIEKETIKSKTCSAIFFVLHGIRKNINR